MSISLRTHVCCGKVLCYPDMLNKKQRERILHEKLPCSKNIDNYLNSLISQEVKFTQKYVECNTTYQVLRIRDVDCEQYRYDLSTSELNKNWVLYVSLNEPIVCHFDNEYGDVILEPGNGVLISETDEDFNIEVTTNHFLTLSDETSTNNGKLLVKKMF